MQPPEASEILRKFNAWRRNDEDDSNFADMIDVKKIGQAIDVAIDVLSDFCMCQGDAFELIGKLEADLAEAQAERDKYRNLFEKFRGSSWGGSC